MSTRTASSLFDGSTGDLTLQSSDGVDFHCFSQILVAASPVFEGMVAVGNPTPDPSSAVNNRPVVPLTEDSRTLDSLLRFIYPISKPPQPRSLDDIPPLLEASLKYIMEYSTSALMQELIAFALTRPMQVWAIGCRFSLEDVARAGAERMLLYRRLGSYAHGHKFVPIEEFIRTADARGVSAADYYRLLTYRRQRGDVEQGFTFTRPLPSQGQVTQDSNVPWSFFLSEIAFPDATCYAVDGITFPVHKDLLGMSSPVLKERIMEEKRRRDTRGTSSDHSPWHIHLQEESSVLAYVLRLCYPGDAPLPEDPHQFLLVLKAAQKYEMARIAHVLSAKWQAIFIARPTSAYFAALEHDFPELAQVAARSLSPASLWIYAPEMENAPAIDWQRIHDYQAAAQRAVDLVSGWTGGLWHVRHAPTSPSSHAPHLSSIIGGNKQDTTSSLLVHDRESSISESRGERWVKKCQKEVFEDVRRTLLARDMPMVEELMRRSVAPTLTTKPWCACCLDTAQNIMELGTTLRQGMMSVLDEIPLTSN